MSFEFIGNDLMFLNKFNKVSAEERRNNDANTLNNIIFNLRELLFWIVSNNKPRDKRAGNSVVPKPSSKKNHELPAKAQEIVLAITIFFIFIVWN